MIPHTTDARARQALRDLEHAVGALERLRTDDQHKDMVLAGQGPAMDLLAEARRNARAVLNDTAPRHAEKPAETAMVDAAMTEMQHIVPPLTRTQCSRLVRAAMAAAGGAAAAAPSAPPSPAPASRPRRGKQRQRWPPSSRKLRATPSPSRQWPPPRYARCSTPRRRLARRSTPCCPSLTIPLTVARRPSTAQTRCAGTRTTRKRSVMPPPSTGPCTSPGCTSPNCTARTTGMAVCAARGRGPTTR